MWNSTTYQMSVMKPREENDYGYTGSTPPPFRNNATGNTLTSIRRTGMFAGGALIANRVYKDVTSNVKLMTGSTQKQEAVNEAIKMSGYAISVIMTKGWALVPIVLNEGSQAYWRHKSVEIDNRRIEFESVFYGERLGNNIGSAYHG